MQFTLSKHAEDALRERSINPEWVAATLAEPTCLLPDATDVSLMHALRAIEDFDFRVLRVIFDPGKQPPRVITAYFDRAMKGKL